MVELLQYVLGRLFAWLMVVLLCGLAWFSTDPDRLEPAPIPMPRWLAILLRRPPGTPISVYSVARYGFSLLWFIWDTAVIMLIPGDQSPGPLVGAAALVLLLIANLYALIVTLIQRSHRNPPE